MKKGVILAFAVLLSWPAISVAQPAQWILEPQFSSLEPIGFEMYKVEKDGRFGVLDKDGHIIAGCDYSEICPFAEGNCLLLKNGRIKSILNSRKVITDISDELYPDDDYPYFSEGLLAVRNMKGFWGYIDTRGTMAIKPDFKAAYPFSCGLAAVVLSRNGSSCYMHINSAGEKSRVGSGFGGYEFFYFVSSFVNDGMGGSFALVCADYNLYKMDINGNMISGYKLRLTSDPTKNPKREIEYSRQIAVRFDKAWRPIMIKQGSREETYPDALSESADPIGTPKTDIEIKSFDNGGYGICMSNNQVLRNRWEDVIPLGNNVCAARQTGLYGVIRLSANQSFSNEIILYPTILRHCRPFDVEGELLKIQGPDIEMYASLKGSNKFVGLPVNGNKFSIRDVMVDDLENTSSVSADFYCNLNGLEFDLGTYKSDITFEPAFKVAIPDSGTQDKSGDATIYITLSNTAPSSESGPVKLRINDSIVKSFDSIAAGESVRVPVTLAIDMGMEDFKTLRITADVCETGCRPLKFAGNVTIQRYYSR